MYPKFFKMKIFNSKIGLFGLLLCGLCWGTVAHGQMDREAIQKLYLDYLSEQGYQPKVDEDGDVQFKREGFTYFISVDEQDPEFFGLMLPNIWEIESDEERLYALFACNEATANTKVAKAQVVGDNVWISAEVFVEKPEDFRNIMHRAFSSMDSALEKYVSTMKQFMGDDEE